MIEAGRRCSHRMPYPDAPRGPQRPSSHHRGPQRTTSPAQNGALSTVRGRVASTAAQDATRAATGHDRCPRLHVTPFSPQKPWCPCFSPSRLSRSARRTARAQGLNARSAASTYPDASQKAEREQPWRAWACTATSASSGGPVRRHEPARDALRHVRARRTGAPVRHGSGNCTSPELSSRRQEAPRVVQSQVNEGDMRRPDAYSRGGRALGTITRMWPPPLSAWALGPVCGAQSHRRRGERLHAHIQSAGCAPTQRRRERGRHGERGE